VTEVIDPERRPNEEVCRESDEDREHERPDEERGEARPQRGPPERVPEVAVEEAVPRKVRDLGPVVSEKKPAERVAGREDRRQRPGVPDELPERRVDPVQPEEKREADREHEVSSHERREPDAHPESDRCGDPVRRLLAS
jgi:hypothetical protein